MKRVVFVIFTCATIAGCSGVENGLFGAQKQPAPSAEVAPVAEAGEISENATTAEEFDTTSDSDRAAALEAASATNDQTNLGVTIASLGDVTETGIWLKTPFVTEPSKGRVEVVETGKAVAVDLIPLEGEPGSGSRISLAAMRLLEVDLTSLVEMRVFRLQ